MKIKFMFHSIKDIELLFRREKSQAANFLGADVYTEISRSKEYSQDVLSDVEKMIRGLIEIKHLGSPERISKEVFEVKIDQNKYQVVFVIDRIDDAYTKLQVEIDSVNKEGNIEDRYDRTLEFLKISIKKRLLDDWKTCIWIYDEQSELLCADLYPQVFRIENRVREFINRVFVRHLGFNWIDQYGLEKYKNSSEFLSTDFTTSVPDFRDINTTMLSITLETLKEIMFDGKVYEAEVRFTPEEINKLETIFKSGKENNFKDFIQKRKQVKANIWSDLIAIYLDAPDRFKDLYERFRKSRNHVAHNKLLTYSAYNIMLKDFAEFDECMKAAIFKFEEENPSDEMLETLRIENEQLEMEQEYERSYWRDRISGETGVEILGTSEIEELFVQTTDDLQEEISNRYLLDECFEYIEAENLKENVDVMICAVQSNAVEEEQIEIHAEISIDDDMDGDSYLCIRAIHNGETIAQAECSYHNGSGHEGEEGVCIPDSDSEYDTSELDEFKKTIFEFIENDLNPYVQKIPALEYDRMMNDDKSVVADFPCEVCGNYGVSVDEEIYPIGKCCYCGNENDVHVCELCGTVFNEFGGDGNLCNGCMPNMDD